MSRQLGLVVFRRNKTRRMIAFSDRRCRIGFSGPASVLWAFAALVAPLAGQTLPAETRRLGAAEEQLCQQYLAVAEDAVDVFNPLWREDDRMENAGFFDFREYDDWRDYPYSTIIVLPGNGQVLLDYAVLLNETDKQYFGKAHLSRDILLERATKVIRWCCLTSAYVENPYPYLPNTRKDFLAGKQWKRRIGWRADRIGYLTLAAALLWDRLDAETRSLFRNVAIGGAARSRAVRTWTLRQGGGNHDQVKHDFSSTLGAAFLFPEHPEAPVFRARVAESGIDMVSTLRDRTKTALVEGKPVSQWAVGWNLYEDYSSDHHSHANVWYGVDMLFEGRCYVDIMANATGGRVPETFTYPGNGFDGVLDWLKTLSLAEGALTHPHGAEYDSYYGAGLLGFCYGSTVKKDPVAAALELQAASLLVRHTRAVGEFDGHRASWAKAAMAYLMHKYHGPAADPVDLKQALRSLEGTRHYRQQRCLIHRTPEKWTSFSWGSISGCGFSASGLCGMIVPQGNLKADSVPMVYCHPFSLTGEVRNHALLHRVTSTVAYCFRRVLWSDRKWELIGKAGAVACAVLILFFVAVRLRRRWAWCLFLVLAVGALAAGFAVLLRAGVDPVRVVDNTDVEYKFTRSDDHFSTAGRVTHGAAVERRQAFFSFDEGPCVTLLSMRALKDAEVSWSGLPLYFYVRPRITGDYECSYDGGSQPLSSFSHTESAWWCVNDRLGAATIGNVGPIHGGRVVGYNWARKDSYRDKADYIVSTRLDHVHPQAGELFVDLGAVFYVNRPHEDVHQCSAGVSDLSEQLPQGWRGLIAPTSAAGKERILAVANFDGRQDTTELRLSFAEGAPVLAENTMIQGNQAVATLQLAPLESFGQALQWYVETTEGTTLRARRRTFDRLELTVEDEPAVIRLRYCGKKGERVLLEDKAGRTIEEARAAGDLAVEGLECRVADYVCVQLVGRDVVDDRGPAVDITAVEPQADGTCTVRVAAGDRSGVRRVDLYCDGRLIGRKRTAPYVWTCNPGEGWHTFEAAATDDSARANVSRSFSWTEEVF